MNASDSEGRTLSQPQLGYFFVVLVGAGLIICSVPNFLLSFLLNSALAKRLLENTFEVPTKLYLWTAGKAGKFSQVIKLFSWH